MLQTLQHIAEWLQFGGAARPIWIALVCAAALYLVGLGTMVFVRRELASRFLGAFASTPRANAIECLLRIIAGIALLGAAPHLLFTTFYLLFGAILIVTSIPMLLLYSAHKRYASWAVPFAQSIAPLFGALAFGLGVFLAYGVLG